MKQKDYFPIFRQILFKSESVTQSKGGIYLPPSDSTETVNRVVMIGEDCTKVQVGDNIKIMNGVRLEVITTEEGEYLQVPEMQVIGIERIKD